MTPARWAWDDDAPLIGVEADDDKTEDETEGSREVGVEAVVGGGVVRVEEEDGNVVEGVADMDEGVTDMDEGVAEVKGVMLDSKPVVWTSVGLDDGDGGGEDGPPYTQTLSEPRGI